MNPNILLTIAPADLPNLAINPIIAGSAIAILAIVINPSLLDTQA
jgi:hypothetical protein